MDDENSLFPIGVETDSHMLEVGGRAAEALGLSCAGELLQFADDGRDWPSVRLYKWIALEIALMGAGGSEEERDEWRAGLVRDLRSHVRVLEGVADAIEGVASDRR